MTTKVDYPRLDYYHRHHHDRLERFVTNRKPFLMCMECLGRKGYVEPVLDDGSGPFIYCGWCEGVGAMSPHARGLWLTYKRKEKHDRLDGRANVGTGRIHL